MTIELRLIDVATGEPPRLEPGDWLNFQVLVLEDGSVMPDAMDNDGEPVTLCTVEHAALRTFLFRYLNGLARWLWPDVHGEG